MWREEWVIEIWLQRADLLENYINMKPINLKSHKILLLLP